MAAEAYARYNCNFGVAYVTTGPGATNAITGVAGAWVDSVPCLFISGQVKRKDSIYYTRAAGSRQIGPQEMNIIPIVEPITKYAAFVDDPADIRHHLERAHYLAKEGRPGPVWLDIPLDVQGAIVSEDSLKGFEPEKGASPLPVETIKTIADDLKNAERPVMMIGQGMRWSGATDTLLEFLSKTEMPIVTTFLGSDVIATSHPCYTGRVGIKGDRAGNLAVQNSDLLIIIGTSLPVVETGYESEQFAREAKVVVVDTDPVTHKRDGIDIDELVEADAKEFIEALQERIVGVGSLDFGGWLRTCIEWRDKYPVCLPEYAAIKGEINIYYAVDRITRRLGPDDIVVTDAGLAHSAVAQCIRVEQGARYISSGGLATMGYNLPASIGACISAGKKRVVCITGDGSFQLNIQELQSIVHHDLPIKVFVLNNDGYLCIRNTQKNYFENRLIGEGPASGFSCPGFDRIADCYGMGFFRVDDNCELDGVVDEVLNANGPVICEVITPEYQSIIPCISSEKKPDGRMVSKPLEDMFPFLDRKEFSENMKIRPIDG